MVKVSTRKTPAGSTPPVHQRSGCRRYAGGVSAGHSRHLLTDLGPDPCAAAQARQFSKAYLSVDSVC